MGMNFIMGMNRGKINQDHPYSALHSVARGPAAQGDVSFQTLYGTTPQPSIPLRQAQGHLAQSSSSRALTLVSWTEAREE
jgi:hypothetical protein